MRMGRERKKTKIERVGGKDKFIASITAKKHFSLLLVHNLISP